MRESFIFYSSFLEAIEDLDDKKRLKMFDAITKLALKNEEIDLKNELKRLFCLIKPQILANQKRYEDGLKGGRPKKKKEDEKITSGFENKKPNEDVNENENVNVNEEGKGKCEKTFFPSSTEILNSDSFFGEYQNVFLDRQDYKKALAICLDKTYLNELIEELSSAIEVGRYPIYDEKRPHAHLAILKKFHDQRRLNPHKFKKIENAQKEDEIDPIVVQALKKKLESERLNE